MGNRERRQRLWEEGDVTALGKPAFCRRAQGEFELAGRQAKCELSPPLSESMSSKFLLGKDRPVMSTMACVSSEIINKESFCKLSSPNCTQRCKKYECNGAVYMGN